ncbi:MAG: AAA family ATPase [Bacteroidales bacterium]|nr:AAA family ATPase [Bacteroidales bacterium]
MTEIIGRIKEIKLLKELYDSDNPCFAVVYGRRRVGKTFLVRETFGNNFTFYSTGINDKDRNKQLAAFFMSLTKYSNDESLPMPKDWLEAFGLLIKILEKSDDKKKLIFLDELSWMDTQKSDFVTGLEWFWNGWASARKDVMLIGCSSATSWIVKKIFRNHGGLYGRVTNKIHLNPFTLAECEQYFSANGMKMSRTEQLQCYMVMGGIPYYISLLDKKLSVAQNIDNLFFNNDGQLRYEYRNLYEALFTNAEKYMLIVEALGRKSKGLSRSEIIDVTKLPNSGATTAMLEDLENCDIIRRYPAFGKTKRDELYQLTDFYTLFYFNFIKNNANNDKDFWIHHANTPKINSWSGYAFEQVCMAHSDNIKKSLGISGIAANIYSWQSKKQETAAQIDMIIDRADNVVNLCEMKYSDTPYIINKEYDANLKHKMWSFAEESKTKKTLRLVMVTTWGLKQNVYSGSVSNEVTMDDLFQ